MKRATFLFGCKTKTSRKSTKSAKFEHYFNDLLAFFLFGNLQEDPTVMAN